MKTFYQKWLSVLCVTAMLFTSLNTVLVMPAAAWSSPTPVDGTMDFSLMPDAASAFTCVEGGEGKVTVSENSNGSFTFKADKGWPCAFNSGATTESDDWALVDFTEDVYLNFDFRVKTGASAFIVYFGGQDPTKPAAIGNYIDLTAQIRKDYDPLKGGTDDDLGVGTYQGSINLKDLYVDVNRKKEAYINPDLVIDGIAYISGFKVFAIGANAEVILNDVSVGKAKYSAPSAIVKELNLLTNGSSNGSGGESEVTFADGVYTVKVNKGFGAVTTLAYGMQVAAGLKDFDLGATTNLHFAIESDTPWRLTLHDDEIDKWFGFGANFATVLDKNGAEKSPESDTGFYPAGTYELCVDYGSIYTWNAKTDSTYDVTSASLNGIYIEAKNPGTMKIRTLKLSGANTFSDTPGTFTGSNDGPVTSTYTFDNVVYELSGNTATVIGYTGSATLLEIPAAVNGRTVTAIGEKAFLDCDTLEEILLPNTIKTIGERAFYSCDKLLLIEIPNGVTSLGQYAFYNCKKLAHTRVGVGVTVIPTYAFYLCQSLESIELPATLTTVNTMAFQGCSSLTDVYFGGSNTQRQAITVASGNAPLTNAHWTCQASGGFPDVRKGDWYYDAATYVSACGYMTGFGNGTFGPAANMQRQDFVLIFARIAGVDLDAYAGKNGGMSDVSKGAYYSAAVAWAVENGIITGYQNGNFGVGDPITREQVCTILYRYMGSPTVTNADATLAQFPDKASISAFAKTPVAWAVQNGVMSGMGSGKMEPVSKASRAQVATIVMRMDQQGLL